MLLLQIFPCLLPSQPSPEVTSSERQVVPKRQNPDPSSPLPSRIFIIALLEFEVILISMKAKTPPIASTAVSLGHRIVPGGKKLKLRKEGGVLIVVSESD